MPRRAGLAAQNDDAFNKAPDGGCDWAKSEQNPADKRQQQLGHGLAGVAEIEVVHTKSAEEDAQQAGSQLGFGRLPHRGGGIRSGGVLRLCVGVRLLVSLSIAGLLAVARCGLVILRLAVLRLSVCAGGLAVLRLLLAVASGGGLSVCGGLWGAIACGCCAASWP